MNIEPKVKFEELLKTISEESIYSYYMGEEIKFKKLYRSPLRNNDDTPSFSFFRSSKGNILFYDFGDTSLCGDVVKFVSLLYNISRIEAKRKIIEDLSNGNIPQIKAYLPKKKTKEYSKISVVTRDFTNNELKWWGEYGIDKKDLVEENVGAISALYVNNKKIEDITDEFYFAYFYPFGIKIYAPFADKKNAMKWKSNFHTCNMDTIGVDLSKIKKDEKWIITKSKKDKMVIKKFLTKNVVSVQSENIESFDHSVIMGMLAKNAVIYVNMDNDPTGRKTYDIVSSIYPSVYPLFVPDEYNVKDFSDLAKIVPGHDISYYINW